MSRMSRNVALFGGCDVCDIFHQQPTDKCPIMSPNVPSGEGGHGAWDMAKCPMRLRLADLLPAGLVHLGWKVKSTTRGSPPRMVICFSWVPRDSCQAVMR